MLVGYRLSGSTPVALVPFLLGTFFFRMLIRKEQIMYWSEKKSLNRYFLSLFLQNA